LGTEGIAVIGVVWLPDDRYCHRQEIAVWPGWARKSGERVHVVALADHERRGCFPVPPALFRNPAAGNIDRGEFSGPSEPTCWHVATFPLQPSTRSALELAAQCAFHDRTIRAPRLAQMGSEPA